MALLGAEKFKYVLVAMTGALLACDPKPDPVKSEPVSQDARDDSSGARRARPAEQPAAGAKFDFYLLAMTVHAAFCADENRASSAAPPDRRPAAPVLPSYS